jgi:hypothetical protein
MKDLAHETKQDVTCKLDEHFERCFELFKPCLDTRAIIKIGSKKFRVYDERNDLVFLELDMIDKKAFIKHFEEKGIRFVKK